MTTHRFYTPDHGHVYLGGDHYRNEFKVWLVMALTVSIMAAEIIAGVIYGSMALLADGWHMSTHAGAMLITALAYRYARRNAGNSRFTFGTGKLGDLAGFANAVLLALIALLIAWESLIRLTDPIPIDFAQAIAVACAGLLVNLICAWLLKDGHAHHGHARHGDHGGEDGRDDHGGDHPGRAHRRGHHHAGVSRDNNLRSAYLHVLADALTSVLAIAALLLGRSYGWLWADPVVGVIGALVIARWSWSLIRDAGGVLLDASPEGRAVGQEILRALEPEGCQVTDLHVWQVGPGHFAAIVALTASQARDPAYYKALLAPIHELSHMTVEARQATGENGVC
jgi:cation diffusion facilitator family transporter